MRLIFLVVVVLSSQLAWCGRAVLELSGPEHAGEVVVYRYLDLFTLRTERIASGSLRATGSLSLELTVDHRERIMLRTTKGHADLYVEPGKRYAIELGPLGKDQARDIAGTARIPVLFHDLDPMDINALISDLNERSDAFIAEDLATDEAAGMQAVSLARTKGNGQKDSSNTRPPTLFITPTLSMAKLDTFESKLTRFYGEVNDPWFWNYLHYAIGGMRIGPMSSDRALYDTYIAGKPLSYDDPEQVRFVRAFYADHLMLHPFRRNEVLFSKAIAAADIHVADSLMAEHDFLRDEPRYRELVLLDGLYQGYHQGTFDRRGIRELLRNSSMHSRFAEHRILAADMLWDLTSVQKGSDFPVLDVFDVKGNVVELDSLLSGPVCIMVTAPWCTYCAVEAGALYNLATEYSGYVRFIELSIDAPTSTQPDPDAEGEITRLHCTDRFSTLDALRMRSVPAYFMLNDSTIVQYPAPSPSQGMAAILHRIKVQAQETEKIEINAPPPTPKR